MTHQVTEESRKTVENASGLGIPQEQIAVLLGISDKTLRRKYKKELGGGAAKFNVEVGIAAAKRIRAGSDAMIIFWLKTRMGFKEDRSVELKTPPGQPLEHRYTYGAGELLGDFYRRQAAAAVQPGALRPGPGVVPAAAVSGADPDLGEGEPGGEEP